MIWTLPDYGFDLCTSNPFQASVCARNAGLTDGLSPSQGCFDVDSSYIKNPHMFASSPNSPLLAVENPCLHVRFGGLDKPSTSNVQPSWLLLAVRSETRGYNLSRSVFCRLIISTGTVYVRK